MIRIKKVPCKDMCIVHAEDDDGPIAIETFADERNAKVAIRLLRDVLTFAGVKVKEEQAKK